MPLFGVLFLVTEKKQNKSNNAVVPKSLCGSDFCRIMLESADDLSYDCAVHEADMNVKSNARPEKVYIVRTAPLSRWALLGCQIISVKPKNRPGLAVARKNYHTYHCS